MDKENIFNTSTEVVMASIEEMFGDHLDAKIDAALASNCDTNLNRLAEDIATQISSSANVEELVDTIYNLGIDSSSICSSTTEIEGYSSFDNCDTYTPTLETDEYHLICNNIGAKISKFERLKYLSLLNTSRIPDMVNIACWENLLKNLRENLVESDNDIFEITLEIYEKLLHSSSWECFKETFVGLVECLYLDFSNCLPEISLETYPSCNIIKIYRLLLNSFHHIFFNTPRIGYGKLEQIIGSFIDLLSMYLEGTNFNSMNIISCLDIRGNWISILIYNSCTRKIVFDSFNNNKYLIRYIISCVYNWFLNPVTPQSFTNVIRVDTAIFTTVINSIYILKHLSKFQRFDNFFPVTTDDHVIITILSLFNSFVSYLNSDSLKCNSDLLKTVLEFASTLLTNLEKDSRLQFILDGPLQNNRKHLFQFLYYYFKVIEFSGLKDELNYFDLKKQHVTVSHSNTLALINIICNYLCCDNVKDKNKVFVLFTCEQILQFYSSYFILLMDKGLFTQFCCTLMTVFTHLKTDRDRCSNNEINSDIKSYIKKLVLTIGSFPLGSIMLKELYDALNDILLEFNESDIYFERWRLTVSFLTTLPEYKSTVQSIWCKYLSVSITKNLQTLSCNEIDEDEHIALIFHKIKSIVVFASTIEGIFNLFPAFGSDEGNSDQNTSSAFVRLIESGIEELHNYKFHYVILQLLELLTYNFSATIYLLHRLNYQEKLLCLQKFSISENSNEVIIDECSTLRSILIARSYCPGEYDDQSLLIHSLPPPPPRHRVHLLPQENIDRHQQAELQTYLETTKNEPNNVEWLIQARKVHKTSLMKDLEVMVPLILELIERGIKCTIHYLSIDKYSFCNKPTMQNLFPEDRIGIEIAIRYGLELQLLLENVPNNTNLSQLISTIRSHTTAENAELFSGFDCLVSTIYIMTSGSVDRSLSLLSDIIVLPIAMFIWPQGTPLLEYKRYTFGHILEWLLQQEIPMAFYAFQINGISWWLVCKTQIENCFWNSMDFLNICNWLCIMLLNEPDYILYFFISVVSTNENQILQAANDGVLWKTAQTMFQSCCLMDHISYMDVLYERYHSFVVGQIGN